MFTSCGARFQGFDLAQEVAVRLGARVVLGEVAGVARSNSFACARTSAAIVVKMIA